MKDNLLFFFLILISNYSFSQILPSYHSVHYKPDGIYQSNLILHLDASNTDSFNSNDLTIWNDLSSSNNDFALKNGGAQSKIDFYCESSNAHYTRLQAAPHANYAGNIVLTLPASDGDSGQALITDGSGVMSWSTIGGAYNDWAVKTTTYTAVNKDQLIANHASTAFTITLPASPSAGNTVIIKNVGNALVTIGRNSSNIDSVAADGSIPKGNAVQLVYVDGTIGWTSL